MVGEVGLSPVPVPQASRTSGADRTPADPPGGTEHEVPAATFRHPAEPELDTVEEQAQALLHDLRESFAPSYLTLISIIEGVLLALMFELIAEGHVVLRVADPSILLALNNIVIIALVWNEYRMGSSMFRWVPSLLDAVIPFTVGGLQAALILKTSEPRAWLAYLATFYLAGVIAFHNMYRRSAEEERNAFVLERNRGFRRLNLAGCVLLGMLLWMMFGYHQARATSPGWGTLTLVTLLNLAFLVRGEANWRVIVAAARSLGSPPRVGRSGPP
jgi:hypothetical protein